MLVAFSLAAIGALGAPSAAPTVQVPAIIDPGLIGRGGELPVVVQKTDPTVRSPEDAVLRLGGRITRDLPIVNGFSATIPAGALDDLARVTAVRAISLDRALTLMDGGSGSDILSVYREVVRADDAYNAGVRGSGVTVAVIDTGIASLPQFGSRLLDVTDEVNGTTDSCINFSGEAGCQDSYGHGTFVAGVIAGSGSRKGVAPSANLVSVKLAGRDGAADVSTLLAAIQWIVSHKSTYGIKVINLSLGTDSPQPYLIDPLNYAVERAWDAGIVVVVAASNRGPGPATITKPGDDPWVITVGAVDDRGTEPLDDDLVPDFSARGPTLSDGYAKPDLVSPGAHVVSLRAPGSAIDENFPYYVDNTYRRGSGTSFATPQVAGAAALMLGRFPLMTPNQVKFTLMNTARETNSTEPFAVGAGILDAYAAAMALPSGSANTGLLQSSGMGSLHASRGTLIVTTTDTPPELVDGVMTQQLQTFDAVAYTTFGWTGAQWHGAQWHGAQWHGAQWHGAQWHGAQWHGAQWHGAQWHSADGSEPTYGTGWLGSAIYGAWE